MPGRRCAVFGCNNSRMSTKKLNPEIIYHNFPKSGDFTSVTIRKEWIHRCRRTGNWNPNNCQICSIHFTENDYERDMQNELLGLPTRKRLKKTAVPTLNLPKETDNVETTERQKRYLRKQKIEEDMKRKEEVNELIAEQFLLNIQPEAILEQTENNTKKNLEEENEDLKKKYKSLVQSQNKLKAKLNLQRRQLQYYKKKIRKLSTISPKVEEINVCKKFLTDNQIAILLNKKKRVNWTTEEIAIGFTLRYFSQKSYLYIRNKLNFPLPALSTLRTWAAKINVKPGILIDVFTFLKIAGENMTSREKTVVMMFDEVKIKSIFEYDVAQDQVIGTHNQMQVCMIRGLFAKWKQPVYIAFDQKMTKDILMNIITKLHEISYNCVAIVSDCGASNIGLWKELAVDINKTYFKHPLTQKNIYVFADAPHLLKLLRNWLLDKGFILEDGTKINQLPLQELIKLTDVEINSCYKISDKHILVEKSQRQNVKLAAELISRNTAQALIRYKPGPDKKLAENVGNFIDIFNSWFDIFNSHVQEFPHSNPMKAPFGIHLSQQVEHLEKVENLLLHLRAEGKTSMQLFQKGMLISIKSLKSLFYDIKEDFEDIHYICTHKLNQDCLENFFFQLRCRGPNEHPSPLEAMKRIRMIILGKNPGILEAQVNTEEKSREEYVVSTVLETAKISISDESFIEESEFGVTQSSSSGSSFSSVETSVNVETSSAETTKDALEYIAGYIAKKFKATHPQLGDHTYKIKSDHNYNLPSWVQQLSFGGLIKPTTDFLQHVTTWNKFFEKYHGDKLRTTPCVVKNLTNKIKKRDHLSEDVIKSFCKLRTIIRINYLNVKKEMEKAQKMRKRKLTSSTPHSDTTRKLSKKMKKILN